MALKGSRISFEFQDRPLSQHNLYTGGGGPIIADLISALVRALGSILGLEWLEMKARQRLRIGNASGYWGDDLTAFGRQLSGGKLDYLTLDFLAEVTISVLQKQRARNPDLGLCRRFSGTDTRVSAFTES